MSQSHTMTASEGAAVLARAWETNKEHADMPHGGRAAMLLASAMMALAQDYYEDPRGIPEHPLASLLEGQQKLIAVQAMIWALCMKELQRACDSTGSQLAGTVGPWNKEV